MALPTAHEALFQSAILAADDNPLVHSTAIELSQLNGIRAKAALRKLQRAGIQIQITDDRNTNVAALIDERTKFFIKHAIDMQLRTPPSVSRTSNSSLSVSGSSEHKSDAPLTESVGASADVIRDAVPSGLQSPVSDSSFPSLPPEEEDSKAETIPNALGPVKSAAMLKSESNLMDDAIRTHSESELKRVEAVDEAKAEIWSVIEDSPTLEIGLEKAKEEAIANGDAANQRLEPIESQIRCKCTAEIQNYYVPKTALNGPVNDDSLAAYIYFILDQIEPASSQLCTACIFRIVSHNNPRADIILTLAQVKRVMRKLQIQEIEHLHLADVSSADDIKSEVISSASRFIVSDSKVPSIPEPKQSLPTSVSAIGSAVPLPKTEEMRMGAAKRRSMHGTVLRSSVAGYSSPVGISAMAELCGAVDVDTLEKLIVSVLRRFAPNTIDKLRVHREIQKQYPRIDLNVKQVNRVLYKLHSKKTVSMHRSVERKKTKWTLS